MEYVSRNKVATIMEEFDRHVLLPLLVVVSKYLNLGCMEGPLPSIPINDESLWGVAASIKEAKISLW
jgi:hypothetical protein